MSAALFAARSGVRSRLRIAPVYASDTHAVTCWLSFTGGGTDLPSLDCKTSCTRLFKVLWPRERHAWKHPCSRSCAAGSSVHRTSAAHFNYAVNRLVTRAPQAAVI
jgi:hypothetical protein